MKYSRWLAILSPALLGLAVNLLVFFSALPNPNVVFTIALSQIIFWLGLFFTLLTAAGLFFWDGWTTS